MDKAIVLEPAEREVLAAILTKVLSGEPIVLRSDEAIILSCIRDDCLIP